MTLCHQRWCRVDVGHTFGGKLGVFIPFVLTHSTATLPTVITDDCQRGATVTSSTTPMTKATLYEKLGADQGIAGAVDDFYERVTSDPSLAGYFAGVDMATLRRHQTAMLSAAAGGPRPYTGRDMAEAHGGLASPTGVRRAWSAHLGATLATAGASTRPSAPSSPRCRRCARPS